MREVGIVQTPGNFVRGQGYRTKRRRVSTAPETVARIRYLMSTIQYAALYYYYPRDDAGSCPLTDEQFDCLKWELQTLTTQNPHYNTSTNPLHYTDYGSARLLAWLTKNPDVRLKPIAYIQGLYGQD